MLAFQNLSRDPEQEFFADGIAEEIITALSKAHWLFVIARNSSFTYKGKSVDVRQLGRELGVRYVLEGSVRKAGNRVRITGQLIDAADGSHLHAERFAEAMNCAKQAIEFNPNFPDAHGTLAAAAAHLGRMNEARAGLEGYVRLLPGLTLGDPRLIRPFRRPADRERFLSGLRKAGLSE